jgi:hypothetical protein
MRGKSMNRLAWNSGFTNDKTAHCNKEPFKKKCNRCSAVIWMTPSQRGWKALDTDGQEHKCVKKKEGKASKVNGVLEIRRDCNYCGVPIVLIQLSGSGTKQYKAFDPLPPRTKHRCDRATRSAYQRET